MDNLLRLLPKVDDLLRRGEIVSLNDRFPRPVLLHAVQKTIDRLRDSAQRGLLKEEKLRQIVDGKEIVSRIISELDGFENNRVARVVNATGVVLHTGLGRAALSPEAVEAVQGACGYCLLEVDRKSGERGVRDSGVEQVLKLILGCEAATAVNNNAAATLLAVHTFAKGKQVLISRGELVEIGGSFRMPDVMKAGGAKLVEVGTTNRTRLEDYKDAITKKTGLILKVHTSNFRLQGFTESTPLEELVALGMEHQIPVVHDLGSGLLLRQSLPELREEPKVWDSLRMGADLVTFSGDKLLGGPQAGILVGKEKAIQKVRKNPFYRAVRLGKQMLAALDSTLRIFLQGEEAALSKIPALCMLGLKKEELEKKAQSLAGEIRSLNLPGLSLEVQDDFSEVGSGSAPGVKLPTRVVTLTHAKWSANKLSEKLRSSVPPVFARIREDRVILDPRTMVEGDESYIVSAIKKL